MATITVKNASELNAALSKANGGGTIVLKDGSYGNLEISNTSFSKYVTIVSENKGGAKFNSIDIYNSDYIKIDGVHVSHSSNGGAGGAVVEILKGSDHIQFVNSEVNGKVDNEFEGFFGIHTDDGVTDITIANNYIHDVKVGAALFKVNGLNMINNTVDRIGGDSYKFASVTNALIEGNIGARYIAASPGEHYDFMQFQNDSSNIVVRGNVSLPESRSNVQGIFFNNGTYRNVEVEYNIIASSQLNGIYASDSSSGMTAHNNTLINIEGGGSKSTIIRGFDKSYDNIAVTYAGAAGDGSNLMLQNVDPNKPYYQGDYFANSQVGKGLTLEDVIPVAGSLASKKGAIGTAEKLLDGVLDWVIGDSGGSTPDAGSDSGSGTDSGSDSGSGSTDSGTNGPGSTDTSGAVFFLKGSHEFSKSSDVYQYAHDSALALSAATLALTFNADTVSGHRGLVSKDASGFEGGGQHFTAYIKDGSLIVRFQNGSDSKIFIKSGIKANTDYDLQVSFGGGKVTALLDGAAFGSASFNTSWVNNDEFLQVGANGWSSDTGAAGFVGVFDGTISNLMIASGVKSVSQMQNLLDAAVNPPSTSEPDTGTDTGGSDGGNTDSGGSSGSGGTDTTGAGYYLAGSHEFTRASDVIEVAPGPELKLSAATISLTFNADTVSGQRGIISKDADGFSGGGHHFTAYINNGSLIVRFQDGNTSKTFVKTGIKAHTNYDLDISFGEGKVSASLNGSGFGSASFDTSWVTNNEYLQIGGNGWSSETGKAGFTNVFDGTISNVLIMGEGGTNAPDIDGDTASYANATAAVGARLDGDAPHWGAATGDDLSGIENVTGSRYDDALHGTDGDNMLMGGKGDDTLYGHEGDDLLQGGAGADMHFGGAGNDTVSYANATSYVGARLDNSAGNWGTHAEGDTYAGVENLIGSSHNDVLVGNGGGNVLMSGAGNDKIYALGGNDTLVGGAGNDTLYGQAGNDLFLYENGFDHDQIIGFESKNNAEKIDLAGVSSITSWTDLKNNHMSASGSDVVIDAGSGDTITLVDVSLSDLDQHDFIF